MHQDSQAWAKWGGVVLVAVYCKGEAMSLLICFSDLLNQLGTVGQVGKRGACGCVL
jgi:hypothetical protein